MQNKNLDTRQIIDASSAGRLLSFLIGSIFIKETYKRSLLDE